MTDAKQALEVVEQVHRVCRAIRGECLNCSQTETFGSDQFVRGCYQHAVEVINTVETGNPWRKTEGVKAPWTALTTHPAQPEGEGHE